MGSRAQYVARNRKYVDGIKAWGECLDCGFNFPSCAMDFDHVSGVKNKAISKLVLLGSSLKTIDEELAKCELVCACCHRIRTAARNEDE